MVFLIVASLVLGTSIIAWPMRRRETNAVMETLGAALIVCGLGLLGAGLPIFR